MSIQITSETISGKVRERGRRERRERRKKGAEGW